MFRVLSVSAALLLTVSLVIADDGADVKSGMLDEGHYEDTEDTAWGLNDPGTGRITPERKPRFGEKDKDKDERYNPRRNPYRGVSDPLIDVFIGGREGRAIKTSLDAAQNINEAVQIRNNRVEQAEASSSSSADIYEKYR